MERYRLLDPVPAAFGGRAHGCADRKRNARIPRAMRVSLYAHRARRAAGFGPVPARRWMIPMEREYVFLRNSRSVCRADTIITVTAIPCCRPSATATNCWWNIRPRYARARSAFSWSPAEGFVKEYRSDGLHSHNPKYKTIRPMQDDNFRCVGRVLGAVTEDMLATPQELAVLSEVYSS